MTRADDVVGPRLEADRRGLLDLTLRNPLLNYRPRARGLELVGEPPVEVYRLLVKEGRALSFLHDPDATDEPPPTDSEAVRAEPGESATATAESPSDVAAPRGSPDDPPAEPPLSADAAAGPPAPPSPPLEPRPRRLPQANPTDHKLQTTLSAEALERRLLAIYYAARTSVEERGVNTLFLALGMLDWSDAGNGGKRVRAPLILVPVELQRSSARERYRIRHEGEDVGFNLSLAEKLRTGHHITLPELPEADELDVAAYFASVADAVSGQPGWSVDAEAIALGFFSFGKFLMYLDLAAEAWPESDAPAAHPLLSALLGTGFREPPAAIGDDDPLDPRIDLRESRQVVDADSTQTLALIDVRQGRNLVIQGPPGTGKSQTITNLIAEAVARGKTVLFVAEKLAALEVVKRRLDGAGVGNVCLELHSHKTQKKTILAELRRTLQAGRPRVGNIEDDLARLTGLRDRLNASCEAMNAPLAASGVTPFEAIGAVVALRDARVTRVPRASWPTIDTWTRAEFQERLALAEQLQARLDESGPPRAHPFWGSRCTLLLPSQRDAIRAAIPAAKVSFQRLHDAANGLAGLLRFDPPDTPAACDRLANAAEWLASEPVPRDCQVTAAAWRDHRGEIEEVLSAIEAFHTLTHQRAFRAVWGMAWEHGHDPAALQSLHEALIEADRRGEFAVPTELGSAPREYGQDTGGLRALRAELVRSGGSWRRFFEPAYWRARARLAVYFATGHPPRGLDAKLAVIDAVLEAQKHLAVLQRHRELAARLLGGCSLFGGHCDWVWVLVHVQQLRKLHAAIDDGTIPAEVYDVISSRTPPDTAALQARAAAVRDARSNQRGEWSRLSDWLRFDPAARFGPGGIDAERFPELDRWLQDWTDRLDDLPRLTAWNIAAERAAGAGLGALVALAEADSPGSLARTLRFGWYEALLERAYRERPILAEFEGRGHEHDVASFSELDTRSLRHARDQIVQGHWNALPRHAVAGQLAILRREFEKKTRHLPVRQLIARAGQAVQAIKPVFMMSPMSIAAFLPPGTLHFDLVVFDEASQVRPVDAFGALLRGRQAVVVGDSRQLPPTSFFDRLVGDVDLDENDEATADVESILGLFVAQNAPERMLRWHYRSRHESLIAVSNHEFYDDRLIVFPSPDARRGAVGLVLRHLPDTAYDRGNTRTNPGEADAVARAVLAFARAQLDRPERERLTLGVAAFSTAQREAIVERIERLRRDEPACEPFFAEQGAEPFFVKNLENVQGDERDVIFISIGYGRNAQGRVALNFGPLNAEGGERRLNVLITRARSRCEVFTNLLPDDLNLERAPARGIRALRTFLTYAHEGRIDGINPARSEEADAPAELAGVLAEWLKGEGHDVALGVGSSRIEIDLAVRDPADPGRFRLGVTCDGPAYRSARSARDRDRLRRQVLEGLGWRLHRVWSADGFRDSTRERARLLEAVSAALVETDVPSPPPPPPSRSVAAIDPPPVEADDPEPLSPTETELKPEPDPEPAGALLAAEVPGATPYVLATPTVTLSERDFHEIPASTMARWVGDVVAVEGPVHPGEVARRLLEAAGMKRSGNRIQAAIAQAVEAAIRHGQIERRGEFLWPVNLPEAPIRDRSDLPPNARRAELIAPEELQAAIVQVVRDALGIETEALASVAARLLGFPRVGDDLRKRLDAAVDALLTSGRLERRGDQLIAVAPPESAPNGATS